MNKITSDLKLASLKEFLYESGTDIALLQEVWTTNLKIPGYVEILNVCSITNTGTAFLIREGIPVTNVERLESGRAISVEILDVTFINVYAPSGNNYRSLRATFFKEEIIYLLRKDPKNLVFGGDFNCVINSKDQVPNFNFSSELKHLITGLKLKDAWEVLNPTTVEYTYVTATSRSRIDRIYISTDLQRSLLKVETIPVYFSDHSTFLACINLSAQPTRRFKNQWTLNISLLNEDDLEEELSAAWELCLRSVERHPSTLDWWTKRAKPKLRRVCMQYSARRNRELKHTMEFYYSILRELYERANVSTPRIEDIRKTKAKLLTLKRMQLQGLKIKSKAKSVSEEETASLYHLLRHARNRRANFIEEIQTEDGTRLTTQQEILNEVSRHYEELYSENQIHEETLDDFTSIIESCLSDEENDELLSPVTKDDVHDIIRTSPQKKSPGPDGLPVEFYKRYWNIVSDRMTLIANEILDGKMVPAEFKECKIVLIPKNTGKKNLQNFRPISLLNSDYKIICRIINNKLLSIAAKIISPHQSCAANRTIFKSISEYRDIIALTAVTNIKCALLFIDFYKAFDCVNHRYLLQTMKKMGFSHRFLNMITNIATGIQAKIAVNGQCTKQLRISRGVPQGSPLSMFLFVTSLEPFLRHVHASLTGVTLSGQKTAIRAYADDVGVIIRNKGDLTNLERIVRNYGLASGATTNANKSKFLNLRGLAQFKIQWAKQVTEHKTLGTILTTCPMKMSAANWKAALAKIQGAVIGNTLRSMNLIQRTTFIDLCIFSKAYFTAQVFPAPIMITRKIMSLATNFLWKGEIFRVDVKTAVLDPKNGGLGLVDIRNKASALFIKRTMNILQKYPDSITSIIFQYVKPHSLQPPVDVHTINPRLRHIRIFYVDSSYLRDSNRNSRNVTARDIIRQRKENEGINKIALKYPIVNWAAVWKNINLSCLSSDVVSSWYKVVNNIISTNDRLYAIGRSETNLCSKCQLVDTIQHRFTCGGHMDNWNWIRGSVALLSRSSPDYISSELIYRPQIAYYPTTKNNAIHWLMGKYISYVINKLGSDNLTEFKTYMSCEYYQIKNYKDHKDKFGNMLKVTLEKTGIG